MHFIIDAQLPKRLAFALQRRGFDATHTLDLPRANATTDSEFVSASIELNAVVVTKDADFVNHYRMTGTPKLLLISTGNITNQHLLDLIISSLPLIVQFFAGANFVELTASSLIAHD